MCLRLLREREKAGFCVFGFKLQSFKHGFKVVVGFKGCLIPQDLSVPQRLCFWYISDFTLMGYSLFAFYMYVSIIKADVDLDLSFMCVLVKMVDLWFFDQNIGFWKWGLFVIGIIFIYQLLVAEINGFLIFENGVCLSLSLVSYFQRFGLNYCRDQCDLESWHSYINILSLSLWKLYFL